MFVKGLAVAAVLWAVADLSGLSVDDVFSHLDFSSVVLVTRHNGCTEASSVVDHQHVAHNDGLTRWTGKRTLLVALPGCEMTALNAPAHSWSSTIRVDNSSMALVVGSVN